MYNGDLMKCQEENVFFLKISKIYHAIRECIP